MRCPTVSTKLVILLGNPLGHSLSPAMHNRVFEKLGMDYLYLPVEAAAEDLATVFAGLRRMRVAGFNVTIPHKVRIMELLDDLDPLARAIGAVNTICLRDGRALGYNTDGEGFLMSLEQAMDTQAPPETAFLIGAGGAARAIAMTLAWRGTSKIYLCNRTISKAEELAADINARAAARAEVVAREPAVMAAALRRSRVLINTTSLGMRPHEEVLPVDPALLHKDLVVADIVYNPPMTRLLQAARDIGCRIVGGRGMLVYQGAGAFRLWTGVEPLVAEMFAALHPDPDAG